MTRYLKTEGIVIKRRNFGEADKLITVFTKHNGKIQIKASGVRRIASRRSPHVELLNHSIITVYKANKYPVLSEAHTIDSFSDIKSDLQKVGIAYHICELIDGLCPEEQDNESVFYLLKDTLTTLSSDCNIQAVVDEFEITLLQQLGYWNASMHANNVDTHAFIESILERRLKSHRIFSKMH